ncbi:MAG: prepilin-type N-terminal cleavage/methylation domain-containing protein [Gemmatimonadaceae bacterium]
MRTRRGTSLVELVIALALTGIVLAAASGSLLRHQRGVRWVGEVAGAESQLRPLAQMLSAELALLDPATGDLTPGLASDSTVQIRAAIASSLSCDSASGTVTLVPESRSGIALGGSSRAPEVGDSLWFFADTLGWQARRITGIARVSASCRSPALPTAAALRLSIAVPMDMPGATPVRITRQERYQLYRSGDGAWYFGLSDWSVATNRFAPPQPIAGPFVRRSAGVVTTGFAFFDATGQSVVPDGANERTITRVRVRGLASLVARPGDARLDSVDVALGRSRAP